MKYRGSLVTFSIMVAVMILILSCCRKNAPQKDTEPSRPVRPSVTSLVWPGPNTVIQCGDPLKIAYRMNDTTTNIDSVAVFAGKIHTLSIAGNPGEFYWDSDDIRMGQTTLRLSVYYNDSLQESHNVNIVILSDIEPVLYKYRVIAEYPHDNQAYTQGLVYDNGVLYESTGLEGKSTIRIVNIKTGKPVKMKPLASQYFGEGIALFRDQIYQVTYRNQVGFVYDKNTLSQIRSFDYQIREGWGLSTDGTNLIMSDGSSRLMFIEPEFFTQIDQVNVFDNKGMIDSLNEIEYINGKVLANVYGKTFIAIVDPANGKVLGKVEFKDLMPKGYENDYGRVLNGIAYNPVNGHLYITGKNWPVLYEVQLIPAL